MKKSDKIILSLTMSLVCAGCSTTSNLPEGEVLYTGLKKIDYVDRAKDEHSVTMQEEVEAALACAPNGALLGSSYYRTPIQWKLWIYNKYANSTSGFGKWMLKSFGHEPVLMSSVNPEVRALVARNVLRANGYFDAKVDYSVIPQKNPKKAKLSYTVTNNRLYTFDSIQHIGFSNRADSLIRATADQSYLKSGEAFTVAKLDAERNRLNSLFRNNGYYYYRADNAAILADSVSNPGRVAVRLQPVADMPDEARRRWYLGKMRVEMRRSVMEPLTDSIVHRNLSVYYSGKKPPIRLRTLLRDIKLRRGKQFSYDEYMESSGVINSLGLFSLSDFTFTPRDTTSTCDTLDMRLNCVFDKPYDGSIEANYSLKSNDRTGPGLVLSMNKRNAFRGGEKLSVSLKGSYEWQTGKRVAGSSSTINSYEYGADVSIEYPRLETPFKVFRRRRFFTPPSTLFSLSGNVLNRADFFKMLTVTGAVTYKFQTSANSKHEFSPLLLDYNYLQSTTEKFDQIMTDNPAVYVSMRNQFVPKIKYTYIYSSPAAYKNPIAWEMTLTESGNILSAGYAMAGKKFSEK